MSNILNFSRSFWATAVAYKGSDNSILRDYDILKEKEAGKSLTQIAIKYGLSRRQICNILAKHKK